MENSDSSTTKSPMTKDQDANEKFDNKARLEEETQKQAIENAELKKTIKKMRFCEAITPYGFWNRLTHSEGTFCKMLIGIDLDIGVVDNYVNTFSLVNALVLTIPFGVIGSYDTSFWQGYLAQMSEYNCGDNFTDSYNGFVSAIINVVYCSIGALVVAVFYYIFRPDSPDKANWQLGELVVGIEQVLQELKQLNKFNLASLSHDKSQEAAILSYYKDHSDELDRSSLAIKQAIETKSSKMVEDSDKDQGSEFQAWWERGRIVILAIFIMTTISVWNLFFIIWDSFTMYSIPQNYTCGGGANESKMGMAIFFICGIFGFCLFLLV